MNNKKGFTLIELLATIVVIALVATIATISVTGVLKNTKKDINTVSEKESDKAMELYLIDHRNEINGEEEIDTIDLTTNGYIPKSSIEESNKINIVKYRVTRYDQNTEYKKIFKYYIEKNSNDKVSIENDGYLKFDNVNNNKEFVINYTPILSTYDGVTVITNSSSNIIRLYDSNNALHKSNDKSYCDGCPYDTITDSDNKYTQYYFGKGNNWYDPFIINNEYKIIITNLSNSLKLKLS